MVKFVLVTVLALVGSTFAASIGQSVTTEKHEVIPLLKFETEKEPNGNFHFSYEGGDGSSRQEQGVIANEGTEDEALEVSGSFRYIDADGQEIEVHYTAGKNGFVPIGTNIPHSISALAKAAADLPQVSEEEELKARRKARSNDEKTKKGEKHEKNEKKEKNEKVEKIEKAEKTEKTHAVHEKSHDIPVKVVG
ncbi:flexible cuticle protein 12 [Drosophila tropicalis]|uniref:flexible cuticle protein 12 n=1 Tax=Drosophila tropicalis TaxID=46794 RepID=UPI0035ABB51A